MRRSAIGIIGIGLYEEPTGITRAIQMLIDYFGHEAVLITDNIQALATHPIHGGRIYKITSSRHIHPRREKRLFIRRVTREPHKLINEYIRMTIDFLRVLNREKVDRICCNTSIQFLALSPVVLITRLLKWKVKRTLIIYDPIEPALCQRNPLFRLLLCIGLLTDLVTVDTSMQIALKRFTRGIPVHMVHFGVSASMLELAREDPNQIRARISTNLPTILSHDRESILLLFYGRIIARRRLEDLIIAFGRVCRVADLEKTALYIGGYTNTDLSYIKNLRTLAVEYECESQIRFISSLTTDELAYLYHNCDLFVFPAMQPWALAPLEAMAFGKPVLIADDCGLAEIFRSKDLASIMRGGDSKDLAVKIEYLVRDKNRRHSLGEAGRTFVEQNMTYHQTGTELERSWQIP